MRYRIQIERLTSPHLPADLQGVTLEVEGDLREVVEAARELIKLADELTPPAPKPAAAIQLPSWLQRRR